ncbi:putative serine esterase-domain-containing protein, partial [Gautieria morchelliformis]
MSTHLLVLIHGMWGNPDHLAEMHRIIAEKFSHDADDDLQLEVLVSQENRDKSTYDGIDWGGERITEEVLKSVEDIEREGTRKVTHFSVVGYSLGGLLARYVLGVLLTRKFFDNVIPVNFTTFATPHFGLPHSGSFRSSLFARLGPYFLSRTGEHFYGCDQWSGTGLPLLEVMADKDRVFFEALSRFPHINIYANAVNDMTVPFITAAVQAADPFKLHETNGIRIHMNEKYAPLIDSFELPSSPPPPPPKPPLLSLDFLRRFKPRRPWLPPVLQFRFPGSNVQLFTMLFPFLLPLILGAVVFRLGLDARASRARIKDLEMDPSSSSSLIHLLYSIEREVDDAVADLLDDPPLAPETPSPGGSEPPSPSSETEPDDVQTDTDTPVTPDTSSPPVLTETQHKIIASLNSLPQLHKHFAFIHPVMNSHAVIISRDVKRFDLHRKGEGVLRHWADRFELY